MNIPYIFLSRVFSVNNYVSCNYYKGTLALAGMLIEKVHALSAIWAISAIPTMSIDTGAT